MSRQPGLNSFAGTLEVLAGGPLDARTVVTAKSDLTTNGTFTYPYIGMIVSVENEGKAYILKNIDYTNIENWKEIGTGSGGSSTLAELEDVNLTSETNNDALVYNSGEWTNIPLSTVALTGSYVSLSGQPTKLTDFTNDLIATTETPGTVKPDGNTIRFNRLDNEKIELNTENLATQDDISDINNSIDEIETSIPNLIEFTEEELYNMVWEDLDIASKPAYTEADLDDIIDQIDFHGGGIATEMSAADMLSIWNEIFDS